MRIRKRWVVAGVSVALVVVPASFVIDLMWATPAPRFNAVERLDEVVRSVQPAGENAWPLYWAVLAGKTPGAEASSMAWPIIDETGEWPPHLPTLGDWSDERNDAWREILADSTLLIEEFIAATRLPGYRRVVAPGRNTLDPPDDAMRAEGADGQLHDELPRHLWLQRKFARLMVAGMRQAAADGDLAEVARLVGAGVRTGRHNTLQGFGIEWLLGLSNSGLFLEETRRLLREESVPADACRALLDAIGEPQSIVAPLTHVVEAERVYAQDLIQHAFDSRGRLVVWTTSRSWADLDAAPTLEERASNLIGLLHPDHDETRAVADAFFDKALRFARGETVDADAAWEAIEAVPVVYIVAPAIFNVLRITRHNIQQAAGTRVMLHLEIHHAEHGRWPESLADAMPVAETICPGSDEAFEYIAREDGYDLFIPRSAPAPDEDGWESDEQRRLTAERPAFPEEEW